MESIWLYDTAHLQILYYNRNDHKSITNQRKLRAVQGDLNTYQSSEDTATVRVPVLTLQLQWYHNTSTFFSCLKKHLH